MLPVNIVLETKRQSELSLSLLSDRPSLVHHAVLLGRRKTVYSTTRTEKANYLLFTFPIAKHPVVGSAVIMVLNLCMYEVYQWIKLSSDRGKRVSCLLPPSLHRSDLLSYLNGISITRSAYWLWDRDLQVLQLARAREVLLFILRNTWLINL